MYAMKITSEMFNVMYGNVMIKDATYLDILNVLYYRISENPYIPESRKSNVIKRIKTIERELEDYLA